MNNPRKNLMTVNFNVESIVKDINRLANITVRKARNSAPLRNRFIPIHTKMLLQINMLQAEWLSGTAIAFLIR
jgi:hypothetical protein